MRIFVIRDGTDETKKDLAYLFYYEAEKAFYIELPKNADPWETPLLLSSFLKKGEYTVNSYWSKVWVQQRIVPPDRQNINQILRDNGLKEYDEFQLLMLVAGRCEQDEYYLEEITKAELPDEIQKRFERRVEDVVVLGNCTLLVFFRDSVVRKCDLTEYFAQNRRFAILAKRPDYFSYVQPQTGGYGIRWDDNLFLPDFLLYKMGKRIWLTAEELRIFVSEEIILGAEAAEMLNCSRQYINELVKTGKLHPVKTSGKTTLFWKKEVLSRRRSQ